MIEGRTFIGAATTIIVDVTFLVPRAACLRVATIVATPGPAGVNTTDEVPLGPVELFVELRTPELVFHFT